MSGKQGRTARDNTKRAPTKAKANRKISSSKASVDASSSAKAVNKTSSDEGSDASSDKNGASSNNDEASSDENYASSDDENVASRSPLEIKVRALQKELDEVEDRCTRYLVEILARKGVDIASDTEDNETKIIKRTPTWTLMSETGRLGMHSQRLMAQQRNAMIDWGNADRRPALNYLARVANSRAPEKQRVTQRRARIEAASNANPGW